VTGHIPRWLSIHRRSFCPTNAAVHGQVSNSQPVDHESDALTTNYQATTIALSRYCRLTWCHNEADCTETSISASAADNVITDVNGTLTIRRADKVNEGVYMLQASNSFGRVISPGLTLRLAGNCRLDQLIQPCYLGVFVD